MAQVQSLDRFQAEQERLKKMIEGKPPAYEDKVMDASTLPPSSASDDAPPDMSKMGFRSYMVESRYGFAQSSVSGFDSGRSSEFGLRAEYRQETLNYGDIVLQTDGRYRSGDAALNLGVFGNATRTSSDRLTLRNLGFPITPHTFADTSLGDISSEVTDAFSRSYRLSLGTSIVRGLGTRVFDRDFDLRAGMGERGSLIGGPYPGFEASQGSLAWLGYTQRFEGNLYAGAQFNRATGVPNLSQGFFFRPADVVLSAQQQDVSSMAASVGYGYELLKDGDKKVRVMLLRSQATSGMASNNSDARGVFVEGGFLAGRYRHELGLYSATPNLLFGDYLLSADNRGAYWRVDHNYSRLSWGAGLDYEQQNPTHDPGRYAANRTGLSANAQYRIDRNSSVGGYFSLSETRNTMAGIFANSGNGSRSLNASLFYQTRFADWGLSRFSATARRNEALVANDVAATGDELRWEQDWITGKYETMRPEFSTNMGVARDRSASVTQTYPTAGVTFRYWANADWSMGGNLQYSSSTGNLSTSRGLSGNLNSERVLAGGWRLGMAVSMNQAVYKVAGSSFVEPLVSRSNDKSAYVYLRWEGNSGTPYQSVGLRNVGAAGGGGISGAVYFDANRNGEQEAGEAGVPGVEVFLDGRYRVTTDRDGRFEFPMVATGRHQLTLTPESVPLPWGPGPDQRVSVDVPLRGQATISIPVVRVAN